jgi:hypothetical protein
MRSCAPPLLASLLLAGWLVTGWAADPVAPAQAAADTARQRLLEQRLGLLRQVLARAGEGSDVDAARRHVDAAAAALGGGDLARAEAELHDAFPLAGQAMRAAGAEARQRQREQGRFGERRPVVDSLLEAFASIAAEKGEAVRELLDPRAEAELLDAVDALAAAGDYRAANESLERIYQRLVVALSQARAHETLEHRLVFSSPAEEYDYERRRYQTHTLLLQTAVADRSPKDPVRADAEAGLAAAERVHGQAERVAAGGDFRAAIAAEEAAVHGLIQAIRRAGMFIPE